MTIEFSLEERKAGTFLEVLKRRYACKRFRKAVSLSADTLTYLLECGRLSPSSFGLEPWFFVAVTDPGKIAALGDACFGQEPAYTCSCAIVILARKEAAFGLGSEFVKKRAGRFPGGYPVFADDYRGYHDFLEKEKRILHWARAQTYIACANMMTGAAAIGLDSCPLEGFDEPKLLDALGKNGADWIVGIVLALGLRDEKIRPKIREMTSDLSEIV